MSLLVVGIGHPDRGDDAVGPAVGERVRERANGAVEVTSVRGDLFAMIERWKGRDTVVLVDAMHSGAPPGTVRRFDVGREGLGASGAAFASTHSVDLQQAVDLAGSLDRMPGRLIVYGIEAGRFDLGAGLSTAVSAAVTPVAERILEEADTGAPTAADVLPQSMEVQ